MKNTIYIYFNTQTRKPIFLTDDQEQFKNVGFSLIREIEIEGNEFNLARFRWEGDFDTGRLVDLFAEKKAVVTEEEIDAKYFGIFFRKYPFESALFNIIEALHRFRNGSEMGGDVDRFAEMAGFLQKILDKKKHEIEFFSSSKNHIYEDKAFQKERIESSFKVSG